MSPHELTSWARRAFAPEIGNGVNGVAERRLNHCPNRVSTAVHQLSLRDTEICGRSIPALKGRATIKCRSAANRKLGSEGRIRGLLVSDRKFGGDVSCLVEEFFGATRFNPCSEANDGFSVFTKPAGGVAFDSKVNDSEVRATAFPHVPGSHRIPILHAKTEVHVAGESHSVG